jgi:hypothetical protein
VEPNNFFSVAHRAMNAPGLVVAIFLIVSELAALQKE